jgi:hypothetical protein
MDWRSGLRVGLLLVFGACKAELADIPDASGSQSDGNNTQSDGGNNMTDGNVPLGPWGTPSKVPGADSTLDEDDATLSSTRLEMYFKRVDADSANLYVMTRMTPTAPWGAPQPLTVLNSTAGEESPRLSENDLTMYFGRGGDIYKTTRTAVGQPWSAAQIVAPLNTAANEKWGLACAGGYAMVSRAVTGQGQEIFEGDINGGTNTAVAQLNSASQEQGMYLSADCLRVYYQSNRTNAQFDIYMATRTSMTSAWSNPTVLTDFNTATLNEEDPWISTDQRTFVFANNASGNKDIYISTR